MNKSLNLIYIGWGLGAGRADRVKILSNWRVFNKMELNIVQILPKPASNCSKLTIETLEQGVTYVQSLR